MRSPQGIAARIAAAYALLASAWILLSGLVVTRLPQPLEGMVEIGKGLLFVLVTSLLLYLVIARWTHAAADEARRAAHAERELKRVVDTVPVGLLLLDGTGVVTFMNPAAELLLGVETGQCVGTSLEALCGADLRTASSVSVSELLATGSIDGLELPVPGGSGSRPVIARAARLERSTHNSGWVVALADNTTAQEQTDRFKRLLEGYRFISEMAAVVGRSRDSVQLFSQLCRLAVDVGGFKAAWAIVRNDADNKFETAGRVGLGDAGVRVTESMLAGAEDSSARFPLQLSQADILICNDMAERPDTPWLEAGKESGFASYAAFSILEHGVVRAAAVLFGESPNYFGVEERKLLTTLKTDLAYALERMSLDALRGEAEEALARSEEGYRQLFDAYPQPMWVYSKDDLGFVAVNDAAIAKYGYSREEFAQMTIKDIRPAEQIPQLLRHVARKEPGLVDSGYWTHHDASGREFPVHILTHGITWDGQDAELVMVQEVAQV